MNRLSMSIPLNSPTSRPLSSPSLMKKGGLRLSSGPFPFEIGGLQKHEVGVV